MEITKDEELNTKSKGSNEDNQNCKIKEQPPMIEGQTKLSKDKESNTKNKESNENKKITKE